MILLVKSHVVQLVVPRISKWRLSRFESALPHCCNYLKMKRKEDNVIRLAVCMSSMVCFALAILLSGLWAIMLVLSLLFYFCLVTRILWILNLSPHLPLTIVEVQFKLELSNLF